MEAYGIMGAEWGMGGLFEDNSHWLKCHWPTDDDGDYDYSIINELECKDVRSSKFHFLLY